MWQRSWPIYYGNWTKLGPNFYMFYRNINVYIIYTAIFETSTFCLIISASLKLINLSTPRTELFKNSWCFMSALYVIGIVLNVQHALLYLFLITEWWGSYYYYPHCREKEIEAQRREATVPRFPTQFWTRKYEKRACLSYT